MTVAPRIGVAVSGCDSIYRRSRVLSTKIWRHVRADKRRVKLLTRHGAMLNNAHRDVTVLVPLFDIRLPL